MNYFIDTEEHERGYPEVAPHKLAAQPPHRLIDVRGRGEFHGELGHIPGAELVSLDTLESVARSWDRNDPLVAVCRSGKRSGMAVETLIKLGFANVANLRGGMLAYRADKAGV